jgi:hypothetical protein
MADQRLNVTVSLSNTLAETNSLAAASNWTIQGFPIAVWGGCDFALPIEFAVLKGNYSSGEIQAMNNNSTGGQMGVICMEGASVKTIAFQPSSNEVNLTGTAFIANAIPNQSLGSYRLESNFTVSGYWAYPLTANDSQDLMTPVNPEGVSFQYPEVSPVGSTPFAPGVYTLAVADEWGQTVILHFTVT